MVAGEITNFGLNLIGLPWLGRDHDYWPFGAAPQIDGRKRRTGANQAPDRRDLTAPGGRNEQGCASHRICRRRTTDNYRTDAGGAPLRQLSAGLAFGDRVDDPVIFEKHDEIGVFPALDGWIANRAYT